MSNNPISETNMLLEVDVSAESGREKEIVDRPISFRRRLRRLFWHIVARQLTLFCVVAVNIASWIGRRRRQLLPGEACEIMLTGRFESDNWILAHLGPLSASKECSRIWMVSTNPVPSLEKIEPIYPPELLVKVTGATLARLLTFSWAAMRKRPHVVGGFHIMVNGIMSIIIGRLIGAQSMYFCVGGSAEIRDGGIHSADSLFTGMETADPVVERRFMKIISRFDSIITMGTGAIDFFVKKGVDVDSHVVSGGIDSKRFTLVEEPSSIDLILTGRLVPVKRIDVFLQAVKLVVEKLPDVKTVIVGNGKLRDELHSLSVELGIDRNVDFVGHQDGVEDWLRKSKIFVLTSDSEGLSLSMMEAMMCGLSPVVSDVGDMGDMVDSGVNGYLVPRRSPALFADRIIELLTAPRKLKAFSQAARRSALQCETHATIQRWDDIIAGFRKS